MRVYLLLFLAGVLACQMAFGDHDNDPHDRKDDQCNRKDDYRGQRNGHHNHKDNHHQKGRHHARKHHRHQRHLSNETLACHKVAHSNADFASKLYRQVVLDHPSQNLIISPISLSTSLGLLLLGAKSNTYYQIIDGLSLNNSTFSEKDVHEGFHHLLDVLNDEDSEFQIHIGNALFIEQNCSILPKFSEDAKKLYHSEVIPTDFQKSEEAKKQINDYVEDKTNGKIPDLLSSVSPDAALILINYIFFKAKWESSFNKELTRDRDFHVNENENVTVPFMSKTGFFNVVFNNDSTVLSLPYKGSLSALFILPKEGKLRHIEETFNIHSVKKWMKSLQQLYVNVSIPKLSFSGSFDLKDVLSKSGMVDMFSDSADLSGITGERNLKVSKVVHKAVLSVDEQGAEATEDTAFKMVLTTVPLSITFNRPFLMIINDHITNSVLFNSRVANPEN